jgi:hypothetical protein
VQGHAGGGCGREEGDSSCCCCNRPSNTRQRTRLAASSPVKGKPLAELIPQDEGAHCNEKQAATGARGGAATASHRVALSHCRVQGMIQFQARPTLAAYCCMQHACVYSIPPRTPVECSRNQSRTCEQRGALWRVLNWLQRSIFQRSHRHPGCCSAGCRCWLEIGLSVCL